MSKGKENNLKITNKNTVKLVPISKEERASKMEEVAKNQTELFDFLDQIKIKIYYNQDRQQIRIGGFHNDKFKHMNNIKQNFNKMNQQTKKLSEQLNKQLNVVKFKEIIKDLQQYKVYSDRNIQDVQDKCSQVQQYKDILNIRINEKKQTIMNTDMNSVKIKKKINYYKQQLSQIKQSLLENSEISDREFSNSRIQQSRQYDKKYCTQDFVNPKNNAIFISGINTTYDKSFKQQQRKNSYFNNDQKRGSLDTLFDDELQQIQIKIKQIQYENKLIIQKFQQKIEDHTDNLKLFQDIFIPQKLYQPEKQDQRNKRSSSLNKQRLFKGENIESKYIQQQNLKRGNFSMDKGQILQLIDNSKASSHVFEQKPINTEHSMPSIMNEEFIRGLASKNIIDLVQFDTKIQNQLYFLNLQKQKELVQCHSQYKQYLLTK